MPVIVNVFAMHKALLLVNIAKLAVSLDVEPFIVGGKPASIGKYSYAAYIVVHDPREPFACGSSILNQNIILTAAHCFEDSDFKHKISVRAGSANKLKGTLRYATKLSVHTKYNPDTVENDLALVYVKKPFPCGEYIKRVVLMKEHPTYSSAYVAGWGVINEVRQTNTKLLNRAKQTLLTREECEKILKKVPMGIICGGVRRGGAYAAEGDSGSALVVNDYIQVGLVSFKRPEISKSLVVYTDVSYFYNWIMNTSRKLYCYVDYEH